MTSSQAVYDIIQEANTTVQAVLLAAQNSLRKRKHEADEDKVLNRKRSSKDKATISQLKTELFHLNSRIERHSSRLRLQQDALAAIRQGLTAIEMVVVQFEEEARMARDSAAAGRALERRQQSIDNEEAIYRHMVRMEEKISEMAASVNRCKERHLKASSDLAILELEMAEREEEEEEEIPLRRSKRIRR